MHELAREGVNVEVVAAGTPEDAGVAHPSKALITLRAVGGDAYKISALPPQPNRPHAIDEIAGGGYVCCGVTRNTAHNFTSEIAQGRRTRKSRDFDITKTVECEGWRVGLLASATKNVGVGGIGVAQIFRVDAAIRIKTLGKAQPDAGAGWAAHFQPHPTHHVLADVENIGAVDRSD